MMEFPVSSLERFICRGAILHSDMFEDIDHGKFFVIAGVSANFVAGFFYVNSNVSRHIFAKPEQLQLQFFMKKDDYPFLKYDSFVCGSSLIKMPREHIAQSIAGGRTSFVGSMKESDMDGLLQAVRDSRLFSQREKRDFFS